MAAIQFLPGEGFHLGFNGICAAVRKGDKALLDAVNSAISSISTEERKAMMDDVEKRREK